MFTKCITKTDGKTINDAEDLDMVMPKYNFLEYSLNDSNMTSSFWFSDKAANFNNVIVADDNSFKPSKYKTKFIECT